MNSYQATKLAEHIYEGLNYKYIQGKTGLEIIFQLVQSYFADKVAEVWGLDDLEDDYEFTPGEGVAFLKYWYAEYNLTPGLSLETLSQAAADFGLKRKPKPPPKESNN